jgi:hypothetical protein
MGAVVVLAQGFGAALVIFAPLFVVASCGQVMVGHHPPWEVLVGGYKQSSLYTWRVLGFQWDMHTRMGPDQCSNPA